ncbi:DNA recombination protein RmuC [Daejeonella oryzae]|uniref:DNA recombination protein RmuC n=1 Tax=Daejeonella oryzae TaxID=1122943 RepID=UPI00041397DA|nr:DNA recombination protein RmuC [Daejeonella oryzae]
MDISVLLACTAIFLVLLFFFIKKPNSGIHTDHTVLIHENEALKMKLAKAEERAENIELEKENITRLLKSDQERLHSELRQERDKLSLANQSLESSKSYYKAQQEKIAELNDEREKNQQRFNKDFELIAAKILDEKTQKFTEQNRINLDILLNPLKENIKAFENKVDLVYKTEADERNVLKGVISQLVDLNKTMSLETQNLTKALKGDNKKQGNWGEMILERILERSGLVKDQEYRIQNSYLSADGLRFQPDVIIELPDDKHLIIDSKVSLIAYSKLVECDVEEDRNAFIKQHITSIKTHINDLSSKNYSDLQKINSPDFVMLFIPIESCFSIAVQQDAEIFNYAWDKRVVIVSPSTLLATLRTIASIWRQERQNRNVMEIARLSGQMYDKFVGFLTDMDNIGKNIRQSHEAYDKALNKLSNGTGNLTNTANKIKNLGAKASKQIDQKFLADHEN